MSPEGPLMTHNINLEDCPLGSTCPLVVDIEEIKESSKSTQEQLTNIRGDVKILEISHINFQKYLERLDRVSDRLGEVLEQLRLLVTTNTEKIARHEAQIGEGKSMTIDLQEKLDVQSDKILGSMNAMRNEIMLEFNDLKKTTTSKISGLEKARNILYGAILVIGLILTPFANRLINPQQHNITIQAPSAVQTQK
jgi:hypothetical protein